MNPTSRLAWALGEPGREEQSDHRQGHRNIDRSPVHHSWKVAHWNALNGGNLVVVAAPGCEFPLRHVQTEKIGQPRYPRRRFRDWSHRREAPEILDEDTGFLAEFPGCSNRRLLPGVSPSRGELQRNVIYDRPLHADHYDPPIVDNRQYSDMGEAIFHRKVSATIPDGKPGILVHGFDRYEFWAARLG